MCVHEIIKNTLFLYLSFYSIAAEMLNRQNRCVHSVSGLYSCYRYSFFTIFNVQWTS